MDTRLEGSVFYETHQRGTNPGSDAVLERLSGFISSELGVEFTGSWMLVAQWDRVHPFPHVAGPAVSEEYGNFLESVSISITVYALLRHPLSCVVLQTGEHISRSSYN